MAEIITKPPVLDETFAEKLDTHNKLMKSMLFLNGLRRILSISDIATAASEGIADELLSAGDSFTDTWTNNSTEYSVEHDVWGIQKYTLENGKEVDGVCVGWHYASPVGIQFSHQRAFYAATEGLSAGTYYITLGTKWGSNVAQGDIVCFTISSDVPVGGRIAGCYGAPDQAKSNWRIYVYSDAYTLQETITPTFTADGTSLGTLPYNTRSDKLNSIQEMAYGYNRWDKSAIRQYLNSDAVKGNWWTPCDEWDIAPNELNSYNGFMYGMSDEMKASIIPVRIRTALNTNVDASVGTYVDTYDKIWLPSLEELYITPQLADIEGSAYEYFKNLIGTSTTVPWYTTYINGGYPPFYGIDNKTSPQYVRLRSANRGNSCHAWYVNSSGSVYSSNASSSYRFVPAYVIGKIS